MAYPVVPAIIPNSKEELVETLSKLSFVHEVQIDVVDGKFVPFTSWPYEPKGTPIETKVHTDKFTIEVDLMTSQPLVAANEWIKAGADMLVFHVETVNLEAFANFVETCEVSVGVSMSGNTSLETFLPYVELADYVQLMGIATIGAQGQSFDEGVIEKIKILKQKFPDTLISIDGSVNEETIVRLKEAGAHRFVSGSAILKQDSFEEAYKNLLALVNE